MIRATAQAERGHAVTAYAQAAARIDETPAIEKYRDIILADWPERDEHYAWAATCDFAELVTWADAATPEEEGTP
jgi:hypothetical protein